MDILVSALCLSLLWCSYRLYCSFFARKGAKLPPGPPPLPVIGNLLSLGRLPHKSLHEVSRTYGPIIKLSLGWITTVVVSSPSLAKEILQTHDPCFSNRFVSDALTALDHNRLSLGFVPISPLFKMLRRIYNAHILAAGKLDGNRHLCTEQVRRLTQEVTACVQDGRAVNIGEASFRTTLNMLSNAMFSINLADSGGRSRTGELKELVKNIMADAGRPNIADFFPVLKRWDPQGMRRRMEAYLGRIFVILYEMVEKRTRARSERGWRRMDDVLKTVLDICENEDEDVLQGNRDTPPQKLAHGVGGPKSLINHTG